jgi:hypothetical protein
MNPHYSFGQSGRNGHAMFEHDLHPGFGGQVVTNCTGSKADPKDIPLDGIITQTEFTRDVENMEAGSSGIDLGDLKREGSTEHINDKSEHRI